jgi:hypothetical protein
MSPQRKKLVTEISLVARKMADIISDTDTSIRIPQSEWTIGDMSAHVIVTQNILTSLISGKKNVYIKDKDTFIEEADCKLSREYIADINKNFLSKYSQRNGPILAKAFRDELSSLINESEKVADSRIFKTHYGEVDLLVLLSYCLTHLLIHGCTIAKVLNQPLPVTRENTSLIIPFIKVIMVKLYDKKAAKGFSGNFVLAIKGIDTFSLICTPQNVKVSSSKPQKVDCSLKIDPLTFFLVSNGYTSKWKAFSSGKISLGGRKPWLAFKLQTLFKGL